MQPAKPNTYNSADVCVDIPESSKFVWIKVLLNDNPNNINVTVWYTLDNINVTNNINTQNNTEFIWIKVPLKYGSNGMFVYNKDKKYEYTYEDFQNIYVNNNIVFRNTIINKSISGGKTKSNIYKNNKNFTIKKYK